MPSPPSSPPPATPSAVSINAVERLSQTMVIVLALQASGYILKRSGVLPKEAPAGMGFFVGNISLPCLLFRAIATLDLSTLDGAIIGSIAAAKVCVLVVAVALGFALSKRAEPNGIAFTRSGLFALAATMSDDIALGLPLLGALFPDMANMLYVLSAMQCLVFNTVAFVLLGLGRARAAETDASETMRLTTAPTNGDDDEEEDSASAAAGGDPTDSMDLGSRALPAAVPGAPAASVGAIVLATIVDLRKNLFLVAVLLGLVWRVCIGDAPPQTKRAPDQRAPVDPPTTADLAPGLLPAPHPCRRPASPLLTGRCRHAAMRTGPSLPWPIDMYTDMAGSAFKPLVLFLAGVATVGTFDELASLKFAVSAHAPLPPPSPPFHSACVLERNAHVARSARLQPESSVTTHAHRCCRRR